MLRLTLNSLWTHKRRLVSTCVAVVLGVAFMAGTLVLTSTINSVFDDLFSTGTSGVDAIVRGPELFKQEQGGGTQRDTLPADTIEKVRAVDGVAVAEGRISTEQIAVLDENRDAMGGNGPPVLVSSWVDDDRLNPYDVVEGKAPEADGQAVVDAATAEDGPFEVGGTVTLVTPKGEKELEVVGIARFGDADSAGGVVSVQTTLSQAQELVGEPDKIDEIDVRAADGVDPEELVSRIEAAKVAAKADVITGEEAGKEQANELKTLFGFFSQILLVFAFIALFVGAFIISNTFGILLAQRTRELALLRALGASRKQVLGSVMMEAALIGIISAAIGFVLGVGLAALAMFGLRSAGLSLPTAGITVEPSTAVFTIVVGLVITAVAAVMPAIRATRVPPIAALRDVAIDQSGRSKLRLALGLVLAVLGALLVIPAFGTEPTTDQLPGIGGGLALLIVAMLVLAPAYARPLSRVIGVGLPRLRGITGQLARENAMRSPRRTASTASALFIGVTLVVFITVFASSAQTSISNSISGGFKGDYIVQPATQGNFTGVTPKLAEELAAVDGVSEVTAASFIGVQLTLPDGAKPVSFLGGIEPSTYGNIFKVRMTEGKLTDLGPGKMIVDRQIAESNDLAVGDEVSLVSEKGRTGSYEIAAISNEPNLLGQWTIDRSDAAKLTPETTDTFLGLKLDQGRSVDGMRPELKKLVEKYPTMKLQDQDQFTGSIVAQIKSLVNVIYGLLAVSVLIALIGIANTLSLSIHERTRELGLLRATGMSRAQLRSSVRWEASIVAVMGTLLGLLLGLGLSKILVLALVAQGFTDFEVQWTGWLSVSTIAAIAVVLGVVTALRPAAKAAKLNVLDAIATE